MVCGEKCRSLLSVRSGDLYGNLFYLIESFEKCFWPVEAWQCVDDVAIGGQNVVNAVSGYGALELAAITEVNRHARSRANRFPVEDEVIAELLRYFGIGLERRAKEPAGGTTELLIQFAKQPERENRFGLRPGRGLGLFEIGIPIEL